MEIVSKLSDVGTTVFTVMSRLAQEHGAVNLSQGFPDFDTSPELIDLVTRHMRAGRNQYAPMQGVLELRQAIARKTADIYGADYDPETEITVTSGATEALYAAISAVVGPGDEVIIFEPAFDSYVPAVRLNGGVPVYVTLDFPDYRIDWDQVRAAFTTRTRLVILNSPHNPTGTVLLPRDMEAFRQVVADRDLYIIGDEVYEHILFDGIVHESLLGYPDLARKSFVISSFGKTYHTTGWKIGYCLAPEPLSREFRKVHQFLTFASNTPIQYAYADFLKETERFTTLGTFYQKKRDLFRSLLAGSRFTILPCRGTYFQLLDYSAISQEPDTAFARRMVTDMGVAAIPPSVFYSRRDDNQVLRFCFAKKDETLRQAADILCGI
ncbi:MAG: methionine aminotransferase [Thermodesulfobacteriota bacterium]